MTHVEKHIEVNVPVQTAYQQWARFETFPEFMEGVEEVKQLDERHTHWRINIFGHKEEYDAETYEQVPDHMIAWRSEGEPKNAGRVTFHAVDGDKTEVILEMDYQTKGVVEKAGDVLGLARRRVEHDLRNFKKFIESHGEETGGESGEVH